ncbi:EF-hand domain-containing protein, partial [Haematococcus lacustris]
PCRSWVGNTAPNGYGDTVASTAFALQVANNLSTTVGQDGTFASGDLLVTQLGVLDAYGQLVENSILDDRKVTVQADVSRSQGGVIGQKVVTSVRGIAAFEQLKLTGVPGNYSMVFSGAGAARQLHPAVIQVIQPSFP